MADLSDVENALVSLIAATIYPSGVGSGGSGCIVGAPTRVYRGWPDARALDADIAAGVVNITVFSEKGSRRTTRYPHVSNAPLLTTPTITVTTAEPAVTFGGAAGAACLAGIRTAAGAWAVAVTNTMTPANVASALAAAITASPPAAGITATASGAAVTVLPSTGLLGRVAAIGTQLTEVRRQVQPVRVTVWAPSIAMRDVAASAVDGALGALDWLTLADGTGGRLLYRATYVDDAPSKELLWRRDLCYEVEYPTTLLQQITTNLFTGGVVTAGTLPVGSVGAEFVWGDMQPSTQVFQDINGDVWIDAAGNLTGVPHT